jgi:hypothetical protein
MSAQNGKEESERADKNPGKRQGFDRGSRPGDDRRQAQGDGDRDETSEEAVIGPPSPLHPESGGRRDEPHAASNISRLGTM